MIKNNIANNTIFKFFFKYNLFSAANVLFFIFQWPEEIVNSCENGFFLFFLVAITPKNVNFVTKDIVLYDVDFLLKKKNYYKELLFVKTNFFCFFFILFLAAINMFVFLYYKEPTFRFYHKSTRIESCFPDVFNSLNSPLAVEHFIFFNYGFIFVFIAIFVTIIPIINGTYNFFFKKNLILLVSLMEISFCCAIYSRFFVTEFALNVWTKYMPFNYFFNQDMSLAPSLLVLSYFFLIVSYLFLSLIFLYNIFFKRAKHLSFFNVFKFSFFIVIVCFLKIFNLCSLYIFLSCILVSYEIRLKLIFWNSSTYDEKLWTQKEIYYSFNNPTDYILIFSSLAVISFVIKKQFLMYDDENNNYKKLLKIHIIIWLCLIFGNCSLAAIFRDSTLLSIPAQLDVRFFFLIVFFSILIFFFFKYFRLEFFNATFICIFFFMFFFMFLWLEMPEKPFIGGSFLWSIIQRTFFHNIKGLFYAFHGSNLLKLTVLWSFFAFFHHYLDYFSWMKSNTKLFQLEFFFLISGTLNIFYYILEISWAGVYDPLIWVGNRRPQDQYRLMFSRTITDQVCDYSYQLIFLGISFTFIYFFFKLIIKWFKKI